MTSAKFVLLPGAGGAAWYWHRVVPLLQAAGHEAVAVDLPGPDPEAGLPEYARLVSDMIAGRDGVVLAALSLGAFTAPLVAPVTSIVFVNGMIPVPGETPGVWWENTGQEQARIEAAKRKGYPTEIDLEAYFFHDVPPEIAADSGQHQQDESDAAFSSTCDFKSWPAVPIRVVAGADDRLFPADFQQRVARERLGVEADILPGGHLITLANPEAVARFLLECAMDRR